MGKKVPMDRLVCGDGATIAKVEWVEGVKPETMKEVELKSQAEDGSDKVEAGNEKIEKKKVTVRKKTAKKVEK
jgi:hypothetical protein